MEDNPEYTEFGIKVHKFRLTLKLHKRQQQQQIENSPRPASSQDLYADPMVRNPKCGARSRRTNSTASSLADSLRQLDLDPKLGQEDLVKKKEVLLHVQIGNLKDFIRG